MRNKLSVKIISGLVLVSLVFGIIPIDFSSSIFSPKKADAQVFVPVYDHANFIVNAITAANTEVLVKKEVVLDSIFYFAAKLIIRGLTKSLVNWINSGFHGNPSFVQNPEQFFAGIADQVAGEFIFDNLGDLGHLICSPFDLQLRLALHLNFASGGNRFDDRIRCSLTGIIGNVKGAMQNFIGGDFNQGGWNGWFALTQIPANNPYGAYLEAEGELALRISSRVGSEQNQLNWGQGFLSFKDSTGKIVTPGKVIEDQLALVLGSGVRQLELADEFNEIVSALLGQLLTKVFSSTGLSGVSEPDSNGKSFLDKIAEECQANPNDPSCKGIDPPTPEPMPEPTGGDNGGQCVPVESKNIALNKTAVESSPYEGTAGPESAVDGSTNNCAGSEFCSSISQPSNSEPSPWWEVDTATSTVIDTINIYPRTRRPLTDFYVFVSDNPIPRGLTPLQLVGTEGIWNKAVADATQNPTTITVGHKGRYVRIMRNGGGYLELVEVKVMTTVHNICPANPSDPIPPDPGDPNPTGGGPVPRPGPIPSDAIKVTDFGATPNDSTDDTTGIQNAINSASAGKTVLFPQGKYLAHQLTLKSGVRYAGAQNSCTGNACQITSTVEISTSATSGSGAFGIIIPGGSSNITIDGLALKSNNGIIALSGGGGFNNIKIIGNDFVWGYAGNYYNRHAIRATGGATGLIIEQNYFHDSLTSDRNVDLVSVINSSYSYNKFFKVNDGGHVDGLTKNFRFVGNYGTQIHRMGLEFQDHDTTDTNHDDNIKIAHNTFFDWYKPYWDSFGLSIVPQRGTNIMIDHNYMSGINRIGGWGVTDSGGAHRFGYCIEAGLASGLVEENICGGPWVEAVSVPIANTPLKNNHSYGVNAWGTFTGEPGLHGYGSVRDLGGNTHDTNENNTPAPPAAPW